MKYVFAPILLLAALAFGQSWVVEQVDSTAASGSPVELVKAADGRLWAGYGTKSGAARVACLGDSGWSFTDLCSKAVLPSPDFRPFFAASSHGELCLACHDSSIDSNCLCRMVGDTWHREVQPFQDSGSVDVVAYDTSGRLYILFQPWTARFLLGHETDSGWNSSEVVQLPDYAYTFLFDVGYLTIAADGSPWFFGFSGWDDSPYKGDFETALLHFSGDTWALVWDIGRWPNSPPIPVVLVPHGDGVGNLTSCHDYIMCDSEPITMWPYVRPVAGLAYTADGVPLVASVPSVQAAAPVFAFKTNRWHVEDIPGPAGKGGLDIEVDNSGQVFIVYSTPDSGLWCARAMGSDVVGVKESPKPQAPSRKMEQTVISGALWLTPSPSTSSSCLLDISGRKVLGLHCGANDVSRLAPGVYFVREAQAQAQAQAIRKIVITR